MESSQADQQGRVAKAEAGRHDGEGKDKPQQAEEPRVKQVTFVETVKKEPRKRTKKLLIQLKNQMEFYFGDANLNKDRFMKQHTDSDPEGYMSVSVFMGFRNIQELTSDKELLVKALRLSTFLQVSEDGSKVRRTTPVKVMTQEEVDARTVYVEGFHKFITRDWIRRKFSKCGTVTYIGMPRFKTTNEIKGYAFVEFETPEEASNAVKMLNNVPDDMGQKPEEKVAASVRQTKNLTYWKKRASKEGIDPAEVEASLKELAKQEEEASKEGMKTKSRKKRKKNRSSLSQGEGPVPEANMTQKTHNASSATVKEETKENTTKPETASETDDTKVKKSKRSRKKRKRRLNVAKMMTEEGTSQNVGDTQSAVAPKVKDAEKSVKTEGAEYSGVVCSTVDVKQESEAVSCQAGRKRPRLSDADSEQSAPKMPKLDSDSKEEASKCSKDSSTVLEAFDEKTVQELQVLKVKGEERKEQSDTDTVKRKALQEEPHIKQSDTQKGTGKKRRMESLDVLPDKTPKVKKQKDGKVGGQSRRSLDQVAETGSHESRKRKRRSLEGGTDSSSRKKKRISAGSGSEVVSDGEEGDGKKKRYRKHKMPEPNILLRVMTKKMWIYLKKDYLEQQKVNMKKLKDMLKEASLKRRQQQANNKNTTGQPEETIADSGTTSGERPQPEFVPNVLLEVKSEAELCLQTIKADVPPSVQVAYIDIRPGMTEGYIRCKDAESAARLLKTGLRGLTLSKMEGEAELQYWNKLIADRENKLSDTKRRKRRGKLKILQRAQNPHEEISQRQHLIFDDDGVAETNRAHSPDNMRDDFNAYSRRVHFSDR